MVEQSSYKKQYRCIEDTAEDIQKRVLVQEHKLLPKAIELIGDKKIQIIDGIVKIDK